MVLYCIAACVRMFSISFIPFIRYLGMCVFLSAFRWIFRFEYVDFLEYLVDDMKLYPTFSALHVFIDPVLCTLLVN